MFNSKPVSYFKNIIILQAKRLLFYYILLVVQRKQLTRVIKIKNIFKFLLTKIQQSNNYSTVLMTSATIASWLEWRLMIKSHRYTNLRCHVEVGVHTYKIDRQIFYAWGVKSACVGFAISESKDKLFCDGQK